MVLQIINKKIWIKYSWTSSKISTPDEIDFRYYEQILVQIKDLTQRNNIEFYFVFLPDITGVFPNKYKHYEHIDSRNDVMRIAKNHFNNNALDLTDMLIKNFKNPKNLFVGGILGNHYTDKGYSFVAMKTFDLINK